MRDCENENETLNYLKNKVFMRELILKQSIEIRELTEELEMKDKIIDSLENRVKDMSIEENENSEALSEYFEKADQKQAKIKETALKHKDMEVKIVLNEMNELIDSLKAINSKKLAEFYNEQGKGQVLKEIFENYNILQTKKNLLEELTDDKKATACEEAESEEDYFKH